MLLLVALWVEVLLLIGAVDELVDCCCAEVEEAETCRSTKSGVDAGKLLAKTTGAKRVMKRVKSRSRWREDIMFAQRGVQT